MVDTFVCYSGTDPATVDIAQGCEVHKVADRDRMVDRLGIDLGMDLE